MLHLHLKNPKKIEIRPNSKLYLQTHPINMIANKSRAKHIEERQGTHDASEKHSHKNMFNFREEPSNQLSQILVTPDAANHEQNMPSNAQLFDKQEVSVEGIFLCPSCTCWFTNKNDLKFHKKKWCCQRGF
jgi:hypothetical protein